jgi:hypothetical protein
VPEKRIALEKTNENNGMERHEIVTFSVISQR